MNKIKKYLGDNILDFGCGPGFFVNILNKKKFNACGIDISDYAIQTGRKKYKANLLQISNLKLLKKESFDSITLFDVLEHLADPCFVLNKLHNLLRPDGRIIIKVPDITSFVHRINFWYGKIRNTNSMHVPCYITHFSKKTLQLFLEKNNFKIERIENIRDSYDITTETTNLKRKIFNKVISLYRNLGFGDALLCIARKI